MRLDLSSGVMMLVLSALTGCQCCCLFEPYAETVDHIATQRCSLDCLYVPALDLTRIGHPDWCACWVNRMLCGCRCNRQKPVAVSTGYDLTEYRTKYISGAGKDSRTPTPSIPASEPEGEEHAMPAPPPIPSADVPPAPVP